MSRDGSGIPQLETARLRLRAWREADVEPLFAYYCDPVSQAIFGNDIGHADVWRRVAMYIGHWTLRGFGIWALEDKRTGDFVGYSGLWFPDGWGDVEVSYGLMPARRGQGLASEVVQTVRDHGYGTHRFPRLVSYILPANRSSIRVAERNGAKPDGAFLLHGKLCTIYLHPQPKDPHNP